jgi:hypothetical protein
MYIPNGIVSAQDMDTSNFLSKIHQLGRVLELMQFLMTPYRLSSTFSVLIKG